MKKLLAVCIIGLTLGTAAFADHPDGWGIGIVGGFGGIGWGYGSGGGGAFGLSLKAPMLPVFWSLSLGINTWGSSSYIGFGLTGDYYIFDKVLYEPAKLHWFLGVGGFFNFQSWSEEYLKYKASWMYFDFGVRVPIGISWQPLDFLEVFLNAAPSLGLGIQTDQEMEYEGVKRKGDELKGWGGYRKGGVHFPSGGIGFEIGLRFWI
ncbi:MAG: DUF3996 domain-containing protein [Spirochaetaceae bacterium]|jgi:hypothetical protein|nr:DUF3996 domain-containing protein [Spirochaetaceae bacterium]